jgi:hypothetical protein
MEKDIYIYIIKSITFIKELKQKGTYLIVCFKVYYSLRDLKERF